MEYLVFSNFLLVLTLISFWEKDGSLDYNSMEYEDNYIINRIHKKASKSNSKKLKKARQSMFQISNLSVLKCF